MDYKHTKCECGAELSACALWVTKDKCVCSKCQRNITNIFLVKKYGNHKVCPCCKRRLYKRKLSTV